MTCIRNVICILALSVAIALATVAEGSQTLVKAKKFARNGKRDIAFMHYQSLLRESPTHSQISEALFALGEYYYLVTDYWDAHKKFSEMADVSDKFEEKLFAYMYLMKIAELNKDQDMIENLKSKIKTLRQHSFVFRGHKEYKFVSPMARLHQAVFYIDRVEFWTEGRFIAKISY